MNTGDTFHLRGHENLQPHLWVVVSDPEIDADRVLIIDFTSDAPGKDRTCVVKGGSHPCLPHDSCANYPKARILTNSELEHAKSIGALELNEPLDSALLRRIQQSAATSEDMHNKHRQLLVDQGLCDM